jgi:phosphohistidine phosphatase
MKTLIFMRHSKASKDDPGASDFDRPLTERGKGDAQEMGKRIRKSAFQPDLIIASPSKRSSKTARIVAEELGMDTKLVSFESELYEAGIDKVLHVIRNIDDRYNTVMLVGHNPVFTGIVGFLTNSFLEHLPTSGIAVVRFDTATWKIIKHYTGELVHTDSPKNMRA